MSQEDKLNTTDRITVRNPFKFSAADRYEERDGFPIFSILEITTSSLCTRTCSFCPRGVGWRDKSGGYLTLDHAEVLTEELHALEFKGNVILSGLGEPMWHPNWMHLATIITSGPWKSQLITNGDLLNSPDQVRMFDKVCVSMYDGVHQIDYLSTLLDGLNFELRPRYANEFMQLSNRAGWMNWPPRENLSDHPCNYPMYQLTMNHDGRVIHCCHDWTDSDLGNVFESGLWGVWTGPALRSARETLFENRHRRPCRDCDVTGTLSGAEFRSGWMKLYSDSPEQSE